MTAADKIRILIIDDNPAGLHGGAPPGCENPWMHKDYAKYFDFRWLATPEECRTFRDLTWALGECNLPLLIEKGWIPEILAIDYLLLDHTKPVAERMESDSRPLSAVSPLPELADATLAAGVSPERLCLTPVAEPVISKKFKVDSWGCFAGGLILATLSEHPCAPVPITRYLSTNLMTESPDTWFFEWLMASQSGGMLRGNGATVANWQSIIGPGIESLQKRLRQLARCGIITLDLDELSALASNQSQHILTVISKYGVRRLPIEGLFIDARQDKKQWAEDVLEDLVAGGTVAQLNEAREQAKLLMQKHDNETLVKERIELSDLLLKRERQMLDNDGSEWERLIDLEKKFDATVEFEEGRINGEIRNIGLIGDVRHIEIDDWARKWTALSVITLLLTRFCTAWKNGMQIEAVTEPEVYLALCPVARNPLILPFSEGSGRSISANLQDVDRKVGFRIKEVLAGGGLNGNDRILLRHLAHTLGLTHSLCEKYPRVARFLNGNKSHEWKAVS